MVYISSDGTVYQNRPWDVGRIIEMFWTFINVICAFFMTLIPGKSASKEGRGRNDGRKGPGGPGGPGGPRRRFGTIPTTIQDCSMPGGGG